LKTALEAAVVEVISADPQTLPLLKQFNGVYLQDNTWISLPDALVDTGTFEHFRLTDVATQDRTVEKQMPILTPGVYAWQIAVIFHLTPSADFQTQVSFG
jgi:hypothetical protein